MDEFKYYYYFVEGENEEKIINVLKTDLGYIRPGRVQKFNVVEKKFTAARIRTIKKGTAVVLVFDTDTKNISTLLDNIKFLEKAESVVKILCITQVQNLEDELRRSCGLTQIKELTGSRSNSDFKRDLLKANNFARMLLDKHFDFDKFWIMNDTGEYKNIKNEAYRVKLKKIKYQK